MRMLQFTKVILFDFSGCGHCQHFSPLYDDISLELRDLILTAKVNCERFQNLCASERVRAYPTVKLYWEGRGEELTNQQPDYIVSFVHDRLERRATARTPPRDEL